DERVPLDLPVALRRHLPDVVGADAMVLPPLDVVERQPVVSLGLEHPDVFRADVVDRQLIAAPDRQVVGVTDGLHLGRELWAWREGEEPGAAAVPEGALEAEDTGLAAKLELERGGAEAVILA